MDWFEADAASEVLVDGRVRKVLLLNQRLASHFDRLVPDVLINDCPARNFVADDRYTG